MKKLIIPAIAIIMAFATSAFTEQVDSDFYEYTSDSLLEPDIRNINNYEATTADPCNGASDVCGVTLTTARAEGQHPVSGEFNAQVDALWESQDDGVAKNSDIEMKN